MIDAFWLGVGIGAAVLFRNWIIALFYWLMLVAAGIASLFMKD